jgi:hypothetical protein
MNKNILLFSLLFRCLTADDDVESFLIATADDDDDVRERLLIICFSM